MRQTSALLSSSRRVAGVRCQRSLYLANMGNSLSALVGRVGGQGQSLDAAGVKRSKGKHRGMKRWAFCYSSYYSELSAHFVASLHQVEARLFTLAGFPFSPCPRSRHCQTLFRARVPYSRPIVPINHSLSALSFLRLSRRQ